jgi:hypothetical protein
MMTGGWTAYHHLHLLDSLSISPDGFFQSQINLIRNAPQRSPREGAHLPCGREVKEIGTKGFYLSFKLKPFESSGKKLYVFYQLTEISVLRLHLVRRSFPYHMLYSKPLKII